jgi:LysM repeat protein
MTCGAFEGSGGAWAAQVGYSARVAEPPGQQQFPDAPLLPEGPRPPRPRSRVDAALPWILAATVVLILAVSGGLIAAWVVATINAVPPPVAEIATPTPGSAESAPPTGQASPQPTDQPRHTPTPSPVRTQEPPPYTYVVQRGDSVTAIAAAFQVNWEDIVALNNLKPPKYRIFPDQELLIPGYGQPPTPKPGRG